jgi:hypothetical protein
LRRFDIVWLSAREAPGGQPMISAKQSPSSISNHQIDQLRKRLDAWRKSHKPRSRIPGRLWDSAVRSAGQYGLNKTAKALRLDYYDLKKRLNVAVVSSEPVPSFIELSPTTSSPSPECVIELESQNGAKMRIHLKGMAVPDLNALSSAFWRIQQ